MRERRFSPAAWRLRRPVAACEHCSWTRIRWAAASISCSAGRSLDGLRWPALSQASGEVPAPALVEALPGRSDLVILSWDRGEPMTVPPEAMLAALDAGRRGRDLTVVDLPRRLDESAMLALRAADQVYLVVPAELRACAAAARVAAVAGPHCAALSVVVRQPGPAGLAVKEVIAALRLPYAGTIRSEPRLRTAWERGEPPAASGHGSLATLCGKLLDDVFPVAASAARRSLGQRSDSRPILHAAVQRGVGMTIWPPDEALGAIGPNDTDVRASTTAESSSTATVPGSTTIASGRWRRAGLADGDVVVDEMAWADAIGDEARLVPVAVGRLLPVNGVDASSLDGRTLALVGANGASAAAVPRLADAAVRRGGPVWHRAAADGHDHRRWPRSPGWAPSRRWRRAAQH